MLPKRGKSIWKLFFVKEISGNCLESKQCDSNKHLKNGVSKRFYVASVNSVTFSSGSSGGAPGARPPNGRGPMFFLAKYVIFSLFFFARD